MNEATKSEHGQRHATNQFRKKEMNAISDRDSDHQYQLSARMIGHFRMTRRLETETKLASRRQIFTQLLGAGVRPGLTAGMKLDERPAGPQIESHRNYAIEWPACTDPLPIFSTPRDEITSLDVVRVKMPIVPHMRYANRSIHTLTPPVPLRETKCYFVRSWTARQNQTPAVVW